MESALVIVANPAAGNGEAPRLIERLRTSDPEARLVLSEGPAGVREIVADLELHSECTLAVLGGP